MKKQHILLQQVFTTIKIYLRDLRIDYLRSPKKYLIGWLSVLSAIIFVIILQTYGSNQIKHEADYPLNTQITSSDREALTPWCQLRNARKTVQWTSMEPLIKDWTTLTLVEWYYKCGGIPQRWDVVAYHYGWDTNPIIKIIRAIDSDEIQILWNTISINGSMMKNSQGKVYEFQPWELSMLWLYVKWWKIPTGSYLIFGDNSLLSTDSRKFWAVSSGDFLWKFILE